MGAIVSLFAAIGEAAAATGFTIEAVLAGEAAAAIEAELSAVIALEGLSEAEALASLGISAETASLFASAPAALEQAVAISIAGQAASGVTGLASAGYLLSKEKNHHHHGMAIVEWRPYVDYLFPGFETFVNQFYWINPLEWGPTLFQRVGQAFWDLLITEGRRRLGEASSAAAQTSAQYVYDLIARTAERARWTVVEGPGEAYRGLIEYYGELPPWKPHSLHRGLPWEQKTTETGGNGQPRQQPDSGETVYQQPVPGGANQRAAPDWMLPLILGLYGTVYPGWKAEVALLEKEDGSQGKKTKKRTRASPQTSGKRRYRGPRGQDRA
uniref:Minor capsid protein n=4 Tax=Gammapolyomavirus anseris TaxID=1891746 RepID=F6KXH7_9POLY|nr:putative VP2 [Goose hemorrhagic polyomavirus]QHD56331.1 putative VP2 [Gammapolyomavirus anseris]AEC12240.1 putative VP2 [Goose hemorrhagic polyomavirus]AYO46721.1 putative protein 2 [Goose hemorrhagic polyomavirus]AYO46722.1 putative protein 2 [Goose hemorrhagic polyomavirus]